MKRPYILLLSLLAGVVPALAQDLNPTIVVTNTYEGSAAGIQKPAQLLQVPDSVTKFNLDFDYSVFSTPYRGAYEFHPYLVSMKPRAAVSDGSRLYARLGAGYSLHPEAELVWTPEVGHGFNVHVHGNLASYFGQYRLIDPKLTEQVRRFDPTGEKAPGADLRGDLGADATYDLDWGQVGLGVGYLNQTNRSPLAAAGAPADSYNQIRLQAFARSFNLLEPGWSWEGGLGYRYGSDRLAAAQPHEHAISLSGRLDRILAVDQRAGLEAGVDLVRVGEDVLSTGGLLHARPHYAISLGAFSADLGVLLCAHLRDNAEVAGRPACYETKSQFIYPAVHLRYAVLEDHLTAYADITGGSRMNTYASLLEEHPFYRWSDQLRVGMPLDFSIERFRAALGVRGQIASRARVDLSAGYAVHAHALCDAYPLNDNEAPRMDYGDYNAAFVRLSSGWKSRSLAVDADLQYQHAVFSADRLFGPAPLSGSFRAAYDWNGRIIGAVTADFASAREAVYDSYSTLQIPGYVDLGLQGDFRVSSKFGVWLRIGNLLGQTIQRHPLFAEDGIFATAGICLNIR